MSKKAQRPTKELYEIYDRLTEALQAEIIDQYMSMEEVIGFFVEGLRNFLTSAVRGLDNPEDVKTLKKEVHELTKKAINQGIEDGWSKREKNKENKNE